jgi:phage terminase large subunit-like protein
MLTFGLRLGKKPRVVISTTPKPAKLLKNLLSRVSRDVVLTGGSTFENRANLATSFLSQIVTKYQGTRLGRQELEAELLEDGEGALWSRNTIENSRCSKDKVPAFSRIVVAIVPAVTVSEDSDETGIVVAALGVDNHGYVLADESGKYAPAQWARKAVALYYKFGVDRIIAETNQGGAMVESTIRAIDTNVAYRGVIAKRDKLLRAELVSALYEQFRVHHVGAFPALEDQMCAFSGGGDSPDRLDALCYAITELMCKLANDGIIEFTRRMVEEAT